MRSEPTFTWSQERKFRVQLTLHTPNGSYIRFTHGMARAVFTCMTYTAMANKVAAAMKAVAKAGKKKQICIYHCYGGQD